MPRLIVEALAEDTIAAPGNRNPNYIALSVTDEHGVPVTGLSESHVRVDAMLVGPGGALVRLAGMTPGRLAGTYLVQVVPIKEETWKAGGYLFAVAIERGDGRGQTLTRIHLG